MNSMIGIINLPIFKNFSPIVGSFGSKTPYLVDGVNAHTFEIRE